MLEAKVTRSLKRIIASKKKVLEIQHILVSKRIRDNKSSLNISPQNAAEYSNVIQNYESSIQKLDFIKSCIDNNEYTIINVLREDRYEQLSMQEICEELFMDFQQKITALPNHYTATG